MKINIITLLISLVAFNCFAQTETGATKAVADKFVKHYNANRADSVFELFTATTKTAIPLEKTKEFVGQLHANLGNIVTLKFEDFKNGYNLYKAQFDKGVITLSIAVTGPYINGLFVSPYEMKRNLTKMDFPLKGEWTVFWGGDTKEQNYHVEYGFQKNAFDILINNAQGKSYRTNGKINEDYYAFGQPLVAACEGEVVLVVDGVKDNIPGSLNSFFVFGNTILIKTKNNEYVLYGHLKQHSVKVKQGDMVKQGQILALCGNSGNSSEPHLHFHIQDNEDFEKTFGVKCYFSELLVNGELKKDYSPVKGDKIKALN